MLGTEDAFKGEMSGSGLIRVKEFDMDLRDTRCFALGSKKTRHLLQARLPLTPRTQRLPSPNHMSAAWG